MRENIRLPRMGSLIKSQKMTAELTEMSVADRLGPRLVHNNLGNILLDIKNEFRKFFCNNFRCKFE